VVAESDLESVAAALAGVGDSAPAIDRTTLRITVPVSSGTEALMAGLRSLDAAGITLDDIGLRRPTLDEVFLTLTGRSPDETEEVA
jgi:ABC-2 type transport system ATP-binding protein